MDMYIYVYIYVGSCQNSGPVLGTLNTRCRTIIGTQKGTLILTTTHTYTHMREVVSSWDYEMRDLRLEKFPRRAPLGVSENGDPDIVP